jgi:flagellar L-ring protein FlgH
MTRTAIGVSLVLLLAGAGPVSAADKDKAKAGADNYDELYKHYLAVARLQPASVPAPPTDWMMTLMLDSRARRVNDLITVQVIENITASGSADAALDKSAAATVAAPHLFGVESHVPTTTIDSANLVGLKHDTNFKGSGTTNRAGQLTATMTARVAEVLPNGDLVVEGVREIQINGDQQIVVLTGVARVTDIAPGNVVASTSLGQLSIRYFGRGLMKDSLNPGWLVRMLNKLF